MGIETTQNIYADFDAVEKNLKNLLKKCYRQKGVQNLSLYSVTVTLS
jgi:hypothetical protein